jgi:hypothetical protein
VSLPAVDIDALERYATLMPIALDRATIQRLADTLVRQGRMVELLLGAEVSGGIGEIVGVAEGPHERA